MNLDQHYTDPRLVELYDIENSRGADTDFYVRLAADLDAHTILDLGCGTGVLTRELAVPGRHVIGVDPAAAMLAIARRQPGAERVEWVEGDSRALNTPQADLVVMTGNVAQVFLDDAELATTLGNIRAALRPGGQVILVDFKRQEGVSSEWTLKHVRAGEEQVVSEFKAAGFAVVRREDFLKDNYVLVFNGPAAKP